MTEIGAFEAKNKLGSLLDRVESGEEIVITRHGKPVARLIPIESGCAELIASLKGKVKVTGDISSTGIDWDAES